MAAKSPTSKSQPAECGHRQGLFEAGRLIVTLDAGLIVDFPALAPSHGDTAVVIAAALWHAAGRLVGGARFRHRRSAIAALNALMGLPPVVVGLFIYLLLSRAGPGVWICCSRRRR